MNRDQKAAVIEEVAAQIKESDAVFAVDYRGISVPQAADLRARLGEADAVFRVVKNTLTERAADQAGASDLKQLLDGPTAFTFVRGDAAVAAKALADFQRATQLLGFKGGLMDGAPLSADEVQSISRLPARDILQGQFVGVLASPLTGLVRGLSALISGLAIQLRQIEEQGLVSGAPPPAEEAASEPQAASAEAAPAEEPEAASAEAAPAEEPEAGADDTAPVEDEPEATSDEATGAEEAAPDEVATEAGAVDSAPAEDGDGPPTEAGGDAPTEAGAGEPAAEGRDQVEDSNEAPDEGDDTTSKES